MSSAETLAGNAPTGRSERAPEPAWIDDCGLLHVGRRWVVLPDIEWRLMEPLVARFGMTVRRELLISAGWPDGSGKETALNVRIGSIRRRIDALGLQITNVRGRGYVLDHSDWD